ncbi:hypothetical protein BJY16_005286 [Actinoplanes octamycinicus]|uniref:AB hydrolase-1 domain-containing protein n=1 Tax=Actinoplanes octamycinicus TaxID=135948 RepID=A0A7W7M9D5_9ACTN|nr:alpha/beta hydrolase [Actinoplanes octamycinicus]MBB4741827.1 hypothetical protein [Actinoplanes octamycinicus]GIE57385.1 hypothetical protein Aoc01nite_27870 [Actinoplanes octamycinicus]
MTDELLTRSPEFTFLAAGGEAWDATVERLAHPSRILDLPSPGASGPGDNGPGSGLAPGDMAAAVVRAVAALAGGEPQILVGRALGGLTAIAVAHQRPDLVRGLVLVDVTPDSAQLWAALEETTVPTLLIRARRGGLPEMAVAEFAERVPTAWILGVDAGPDAAGENPAALARLIDRFGAGRRAATTEPVAPPAPQRAAEPIAEPLAPRQTRGLVPGQRTAGPAVRQQAGVPVIGQRMTEPTVPQQAQGPGTRQQGAGPAARRRPHRAHRSVCRPH